MMEKYQHMKSFIKSAAEYSKNRSEVTSNAIQRLLQMLGVTSEMSIFDAGGIITAEFYISLHELMSGLDSHSSLVWCAIGVLQHACHNPAARHALIHVYKFTPILTRLLGANLTHDKKLRVLQLLQELTYGVKISWQEAHLPHLISTLTSFITTSEKDVVCTSLAVLVNLCYKNLPAVYTLMRCVDTKHFLRTILRLQDENPNIRVQVCKLLIILEHISGEVPSSDILNFVNVTFSTLEDAFKNKDIFLLRHIVDFFDDVKANQVSRKTLLTYNGFSEGTAKLLELLASDSSDAECVGMIFGFLHSLVNLQISCLANLYPQMVSLAFQWIQTELACTQSLSLIRSITMNTSQDKMNELRSNIYDQLDQRLSMLLLILDTGGDESFPVNTYSRGRVTALLQLLQEMCKTQQFMQKILSSVKPQAAQKLFEPLLSIDPQDEMNLFQEEVTTLYVHALDLLSDFASLDAQWLNIYSNLLQKKQVQMVLAVALYTGKEDLKKEVLGLTGTIGFPAESVSSLAKSLCDLEPLVLLPMQGGSGSSRIPNAVSAGSNAQQQPPNMTPLFSLAQEGRLDNFIAKLNEAAERNEIHDISTSAVMELYEYKLAAMGQSERALQASLEAANNHSTHLQHRLAQMSAEASRLHQLLYHTQQCLEGLQKEKEVLQAKLETTQSKADAAHKKYVQDIKSSQQMVSDLNMANEELERKLQVKYDELAALQHQKDFLSKQIDDLKTEVQLLEQKNKEHLSKNTELKKLICKLEDRVSKRERIIEDKNSEIETLQKSIQALQTEIQSLSMLCKAQEKIHNEKEMELKNTQAQLLELQHMRDIIYEISAGKKKMDK